jgi:hypothetical protein
MVAEGAEAPPWAVLVPSGGLALEGEVAEVLTGEGTLCVLGLRGCDAGFTLGPRYRMGFLSHRSAGSTNLQGGGKRRKGMSQHGAACTTVVSAHGMSKQWCHILPPPHTHIYTTCADDT